MHIVTASCASISASTARMLALRQCNCPRGPIYKSMSSKIVKDFVFCKQSVMYDYAMSINLVIATMHDDTAKNGLLTDVRYYLLIYVNK